MIKNIRTKREPWPKGKKRMMATKKEREGKRERSMAHGESEQGEREKEMAKERMCEKDGKGKKTVINRKKVRKKRESNGTRERVRSSRTK